MKVVKKYETDVSAPMTAADHWPTIDDRRTATFADMARTMRHL